VTIDSSGFFKLCRPRVHVLLIKLNESLLIFNPNQIVYVLRLSSV